VYNFSKRITKPLKEISNAAKVIADGEFNKRLDITSQDEIGELAKSFNMMISALQNLEEMRRGFIANVSHELRTPMTSIRGFVEGIMDGTIPAEKHKYYLSIVNDETNRLNRLVNDLLDLAKMEAGEMPLTIKNFNINELLRRCVINMESLIVKKDLNIQADFEEENIFVYADKDAIERVIINLLHNAVKFTPRSGQIHIITARQKERVMISIADNGVGIEPDEVDLIWERFYKSDKSRSRDKSGTGLGLAIIRNIINEHKQQIWVESEPGRGTKFTFTLERGRELEKS
jgi:signal transduction histidine kinase